MSLSLQVIGSTSLSPEPAVPSGLPRRTSARRKNATAWFDDGFVIVTLVASRPPCACGAVAAETCTGSDGRVCSAVMLAYWLSGDPLSACTAPSVVFQLSTSCWVDSQYTLRSTTVPCWGRI